MNCRSASLLCLLNSAHHCVFQGHRYYGYSSQEQRRKCKALPNRRHFLKFQSLFADLCTVTQSDTKRYIVYKDLSSHQLRILNSVHPPFAVRGGCPRCVPYQKGSGIRTEHWTNDCISQELSQTTKALKPSICFRRKPVHFVKDL